MTQGSLSEIGLIGNISPGAFKVIRAIFDGGGHWRLPFLPVMAVLALGARSASAQSATFAGNAQHTAQFPVSAQHLNHIRWSAAIEPSFNMVHYGAPLVSQ